MPSPYTNPSPVLNVKVSRLFTSKQEQPMRPITQEMIDDLITQAAQSPRKRVPYNCHEYHETVQRMINAIVPGSYVTPHKHENPDKVELIAPLTGRAAMVQYSNSG